MATLRQPPPKRKLPAAVRRPNPAAPPPAKAPAQPARPKASVAQRRARRSRGRRASGTSPWLMLLMGIVVIAFLFALPTVPILLLGMIPTVVAVVVDRSPGKTAAVCVAGLNFAGVAPFIAALWSGPNTLNHSLAIITDIYTWLGMYGAAACGWLLFLALPPVLTSFLRIHEAQRVASLRASQAKLKEEWGVGIKPAAPPQ